MSKETQSTINAPGEWREAVARLIVDEIRRVAPLSGSTIAFDEETGVVDFEGAFRPIEIAAALLAASSGEREKAALEAKVRHLTQLLDEAHGTPCAQIAWEQERGEMRTLLDKAFDAMCAARPVSGDEEAFQDVIDEIGMYRSDKWVTIKVEEADRADETKCKQAIEETIAFIEGKQP